MIELEINPIEPGTRNREIRVWINGHLVYANALAAPLELREWRDALHNEKLWIDRYLREHQLENDLDMVCVHESDGTITDISALRNRDISHHDKRIYQATCKHCGEYFSLSEVGS